MTTNNIILIICTAPNNTSASNIANELIKKKLAACITLLPNAYSIYYWDNEIQKQEETQLLIKTHLKLQKNVFECVKKIHPYKIPELLTLTVTTDSNYALWLNNAIQKIK